MNSDNEMDSFDHKEPAEVFWGTDQQAVISEGNDKLYFPKHGCVIKAFKLKKVEYKQLSKEDKKQL